MDTVLTSVCKRWPCGQADPPGGLLLLQPLSLNLPIPLLPIGLPIELRPQFITLVSNQH